jgi:hypothetical protein
VHRDLTDVLADAAPVRDEVIAAAVPRAAFADLAHSIVLADERPRRAFRPRGRRRWLVLALAALALVPTAAAVGELGARTGWFGDEALTEEDGSEWLRTDARDFRVVVAGLVPALELPAGARWQDEVDRQVRIGREQPGLMQETGVRATLESYARCAWLRYWLVNRDDASRAERAARIVAWSAAWPATVATDGWGVREAIRRVAAAARADDVAAVRTELAVNCIGFRIGGVR